MYHETGICRNPDLSKNIGLTVNNILDFSKTRIQNQSETESQLMNYKNTEELSFCREPSFNLETGQTDLASLECQVEALDSIDQPKPLSSPSRFFGCTQVFNCKVCLKGFQNVSDLNYHERTQHKAKKYACDICQKGFTRKFNMDTHRQLHFEIRQHNCNICNKGYTRRDRLVLHYQSVHGTELGIADDSISSVEPQETSAPSSSIEAHKSIATFSSGPHETSATFSSDESH